MKKEITRTRKLPAFKIELADVGSLVNQITELFEEDLWYLSISVDLKNQKYQFDSVEEMHECTELPDQIRSFRLHAVGKERKRSLSFDLGGFLGSLASVEAQAENEAWCAGAIEVVYQFIQQHRRWYSPIRGWPLGAMVLISFMLPSITKYILGSSIFDSRQVIMSWLATSCVLSVLYIMRSQLLPTGVIQITNKENIIRRYLPELTLIAALLTLLFNVISSIIDRFA